MNIDFGKPFNGILARINIVLMVTAWGVACGYVVYLGFVFDRSLIKTVGILLLLVFLIIALFYGIRKLWLYPQFRITSEELLARDVGPVWRMTKYKLRAISNVRGYVFPYVSFKHGGKKIFLYVPRMRKNERIRLVSELGQAANKALECAPTAPDAKLNQFIGGSMSSVNPKLLVALVVVIVLAVFIKVSNPNREYSTQEYWESATIDSVYEVPDEALEPGNRNGGVLMWAAMGTKDPEILSNLVKRGSQINEVDGIFKGTPLTGAAGYNSNPAIIDKLIELGADITQKVNNNADALMVAAQFNTNPGIIEKLVFHGADVKRTNSQGKTALDLAIENNNEVAKEALENLMYDKS